MLDVNFAPATGENELFTQSAQHVIVMASNGDWHGELPLLWNLCSAWSGMSYTIAVLDATTAESDNNPGLQQLMDNRHLPTGSDLEYVNWAIYPAALGLSELADQLTCNETATPLQTLGHLFNNYEIILIYASAQNLTACLPDTGIEPLLPLRMNTVSIVPTYQALKHLMLKGRLQATTVTVVDTSNPMDLMSAQHVNQRLQDCAFNFLGQHISTLTAPSQILDDPAAEDIKTLALRLLERAVSVRQDSFALTRTSARPLDPFFTARQH
jgi:hypothetical protein